MVTNNMRFNSLDNWLDWQTSFHPKAIELGLERVSKVAAQMELLQPKHTVITVAGTNGKGSSVAMLEAMLLEAGHKVGAYTSPHMHRYNERIRVAGADVSDDWIIDAFDHIDRARGDTSLSYFEFGTLAGLWIFEQQCVDIALLEVGLGGRLDAVNILDADLALITSIGIDHTEWLGEGRDRISLEKAGVARQDQLLVVSEPDPPEVMKAFLQQLGSRYFQLGKDFDFALAEGEWSWWFDKYHFKALPDPGLLGKHQHQNAAGAIAISQLLPKALRPREATVRTALQKVHLAGRYERLDPNSTPVDFEVILDVAHNPDGTQMLAHLLAGDKIPGKTYVLFGVMQDKDAKVMLKALASIADVWLLSAAHTERAMEVSSLHRLLKETLPEAKGLVAADIAEAWQMAKSRLTAQDRLVVTGSFYTVAEMCRLAITL
ncbi:MAG: bifunctional tetrahydrofolate synthase/dihydrofolate synthase [Thiothrix sp.]|nr:MAG: bifunctional tetrahydrofolate synthase/dihydrofolate synthase [Thiothrix sp.]